MLKDQRFILGRWVRFFGPLLNAKPDNLRTDIIEGLPQWPVKHALEIGPTVNEVIADLRLVVNAKAIEPDELLVELLRLGLSHDPTVLQEFHRMIKLVGMVPTEGTTAVARWRDRKFWARKRKGPSAGTIAAFHSYHTWVSSFSRPSL